MTAPDDQTLSKRRKRNSKDADVTYIKLTPDAPKLFAFPKALFTEEAQSTLTSRHLRDLRLSPLVSVKCPNLTEKEYERRQKIVAETGNRSADLDRAGFKLDLMRNRDDLPTRTPLYWLPSPTPTTLYVTTVMQEPQRIMDVMVERSLLDLLGTIHSNPRELIEDEDTDPLLKELPGRHMWRPGEVYATAYGAPRMYSATKMYALNHSSQVWLNAVSPRAALAMQRISAKEAYYILCGISEAEGFGHYDRPLSVFKTLLTLSGGYGGGRRAPIASGIRGGGIAENFPVQRTVPLKATSPKCNLHLALTLEGLPEGESLHNWSLTTLLTAESRNRIARWTTLQTKAKKMCEHYLETLTMQQYRKIDPTLREDLSEQEITARYRRFYLELSDFLEGFMNSSSAFEAACKTFTSDTYTFEWAKNQASALLPYNFTHLGANNISKAYETMWLTVLVHHNYIQNYARRMGEKELYMLAMMTGVPLQCFLKYFYLYEQRTGIWLPHVDLEIGLKGLLGERIEQAQDDGNYLLETKLEMVAEEVGEIISRYDLQRSHGDYMRRRSAAINGRNTNPLELAPLLMTSDGDLMP